MSLFMAFATGLSSKFILLCQPLIVVIIRLYHADAGTISLSYEAGYAIVLFFMVPLGDKLERKS
jgi:hypothetical protein